MGWFNLYVLFSKLFLKLTVYRCIHFIYTHTKPILKFSVFENVATREALTRSRNRNDECNYPSDMT